MTTPAMPPTVWTVIPALADDLIICVEYDPTGLQWAKLRDDQVLSWAVDPSGQNESVPQIVGAMPPQPPATDPIVSPRWLRVQHHANVIAPNLWRGPLGDFFDFLATNNGAQRKLAAQFLASFPHAAWAQWAMAHPALIWTD